MNVKKGILTVCLFLSAALLFAIEFGVCTKNGVAIYESASTSANRLHTMAVGEQFVIIERKGKLRGTPWAYVERYDGTHQYLGWILLDTQVKMFTDWFGMIRYHYEISPVGKKVERLFAMLSGGKWRYVHGSAFPEPDIYEFKKDEKGNFYGVLFMDYTTAIGFIEILSVERNDTLFSFLVAESIMGSPFHIRVNSENSITIWHDDESRSYEYARK